MTNPSFPTGLFKFLVGSAFGASTEAFKVQVAAAYLKLVDNSRILMIRMVLMLFLISLISLGLVMIPVSLCLFMPWIMMTKAVVAVSSAAMFTLVPLIALAIILSGKRRLRTSNINNFL